MINIRQFLRSRPCTWRMAGVIFLLILPLLAAFIKPPQLHQWASIYEIFIECLMLLMLAMGRGTTFFSFRLLYLLYVGALLTVNVTSPVNGIQIGGHGTFRLGYSLTCVVWLAFAAILWRSRSLSTARCVDWIASGILFTMAMGAHAWWVLRNLFLTSGFDLAPGAYYLFIFQSTCASALFAVVVPLTLRVAAPSRALLLNGCLFLLAADFAFNMQWATEKLSPGNWVEMGWAFGLALNMLAIARNGVIDKNCNQVLLVAHTGSWVSVRVCLGAMAFAGNAAMLLAMLSLHALGLGDVRHVAAAVVVMAFTWLVATLTGCWLSQSLTGLSKQAPIDINLPVEDWLKQYAALPKISPQTRLAEIGQVAHHYEALALYAQRVSHNLVTQQQAPPDTIAAQVAHDIRSPLAALNIALREFAGMHDDTRLIMRDAIHRIQGIAEQLLHQYRANVCGQAAKPYLMRKSLTSITRQALMEKRLQHRDAPRLRIEDNLGADPHTARINELEMHRVLSNLLNNAIEAVGDDGLVFVQLAAVHKELELSIKDSGCGMTPELLSRLLTQNVSAGKATGCGLGISHARAAVAGMEGRLFFESKPGEGTTVRVMLPRIDASTHRASTH